MIIEGLEINSPEYWEIRHAREPWPRTSGWALEEVSRILPSNADVLEAGCGQGAFAAKLLELNPDIRDFTAFDISPTAIEKAKALGTRVNFEVADVFALRGKWPLGFDYVISIQNFEHWPADQHINALRGLWSRVRPGGRMFFTGVGTDWDLEFMNYSPMEYNGKTIMTPNDYHYNSWSEQNVYDLFMCVKATSVKFWRLRGKDRVVAEAEKSR